MRFIDGGCPYLLVATAVTESIPALVLPFLPHGDLHSAAFAKEPTNPPLPYSHVATILKQVAKGLDYLHTSGVVHLDLKPANVMMLQSPSSAHLNLNMPMVLLTDFGLSVDLSSGCVRCNNGTPGYQSPEMKLLGSFATEPFLENPMAADVWSLGVVLAELLLGYRCGPRCLALLPWWGGSDRSLAARSGRSHRPLAPPARSGRSLRPLALAARSARSLAPPARSARSARSFF